MIVLAISDSIIGALIGAAVSVILTAGGAIAWFVKRENETAKELALLRQQIGHVESEIQAVRREVAANKEQMDRQHGALEGKVDALNGNVQEALLAQGRFDERLGFLERSAEVS